jgi:hypothetical protein
MRAYGGPEGIVVGNARLVQSLSLDLWPPVRTLASSSQRSSRLGWRSRESPPLSWARPRPRREARAQVSTRTERPRGRRRHHASHGLAHASRQDHVSCADGKHAGAHARSGDADRAGHGPEREDRERLARAGCRRRVRDHRLRQPSAAPTLASCGYRPTGAARTRPTFPLRVRCRGVCGKASALRYPYAFNFSVFDGLGDRPGE